MGVTVSSWVPAALLSLGALVTIGGIREQVNMPLRVPLDQAVPTAIGGMFSQDLEISAEEQRIAGMDEYVMRLYFPDPANAAAVAFSVYVGYYTSQAQGNTIHSPKNCLPGGGWEPLTSGHQVVQTPAGGVSVNRYLIGNGPNKAVVLYWYQGRGRVEASEYAVKWHLLRDQAIHGRSDEALVRVIVPVTDSEEQATEDAVLVAQSLIPTVSRALPGPVGQAS